MWESIFPKRSPIFCSGIEDPEYLPYSSTDHIKVNERFGLGVIFRFPSPIQTPAFHLILHTSTITLIRRYRVASFKKKKSCYNLKKWVPYKICLSIDSILDVRKSLSGDHTIEAYFSLGLTKALKCKIIFSITEKCRVFWIIKSNLR